ncbi:hypothetical protein [Chryseobacterium indologenes]|uniref:Uncharacterized protein n=1 Tax=Chryseobacterium indologenes TaxID=253 RepID=A0A0N0IXR9_CHRID|nr:hypothetical protein [Chryseobacterium indologenes]KPE52503.1 hypothetical protein AOB46_00285 [Chryseobacterium indologenes]
MLPLEELSGTKFRELKKVADQDNLDHGSIIVTVYKYKTTITDNAKTQCSHMVKVYVKPIVHYIKSESLPKRQVNIRSDFII